MMIGTTLPKLDELEPTTVVGSSDERMKNCRRKKELLACSELAEKKSLIELESRKKRMIGSRYAKLFELIFINAKCFPRRDF